MSADFPVTIFHNPACGTSRQVLAAIEAAGLRPQVIPYLQTGWTRPQLEGLLAAMRLRPRDLLRVQGSPAAELGLLEAREDPEEDDAVLLDAMTVHPVLVNRPIVVTPRGAALVRPAGALASLLPPTT